MTWQFVAVVLIIATLFFLVFKEWLFYRKLFKELHETKKAQDPEDEWVRQGAGSALQGDQKDQFKKRVLF